MTDKIQLLTVADVREIRTTMATTSILWIQERFDSASEVFHEVAEIATKWNAAVEVVSLTPRDAEEADEPSRPLEAPEPGEAGEYHGGIEDDVEEASSDDGGVKGAYARERYPDIRVIVITGFATVETARDAMKGGAVDFIAKPFRLSHLRDLVLRIAKGIRDGTEELGAGLD